MRCPAGPPPARPRPGCACACARSRTSSVGRPGGSSSAAVSRPGHRRAQLVRDVGGDPALRLQPLAAARPPWRRPRGPARRSRPVRRRRWRPVRGRRCRPAATLRGGGRRLAQPARELARRSAPRAHCRRGPPQTEPITRARSRSFMTRGAVGERLCSGEHLPFSQRAAAQTSGAPPPVCGHRWRAAPPATFLRSSSGSAGSLSLVPNCGSVV